jgi:hypothetical protein
VSLAIMRIAKIKSPQQLGRVLAHNLRANPGSAPHADPARRTENRALRGAKSAPEAAEAARARLAALPRFRRDAVQAVEVFMGASPGFFETGTKAALRAWRDQSLRWLEDTWGRENIVSAVLHDDERSPHIQAVVLPIHDGRLRAAHWLDGPEKLSALQDSYAEAVEPAGLRRGMRGSRVRHTDLKTFYRLTASVVRMVKELQPDTPPLPQRGPLGRVSDAEWERLRRDLEVYGQERLQDRARAIVAAVLADSQAGARMGARLAEAERRQLQAEDAAREAEERLRRATETAQRAEQAADLWIEKAREAQRAVKSMEHLLRPKQQPERDSDAAPERRRDYPRGG